MNRAVQPGLMMLAAAALVIAAVLIPVAILRPSGPALKPPVAEKLPPQLTEAEAGDLSRAQRFRMVEQETLKRLGPSALVSALARAFVFPHAREDAIFGIDVSHHNQRNCQCDIDWARVAQQRVAFVVAKATEGTRFRDPHFRSHWEEIARVPEMYRGAYHFMSADDDPVEQANYFLATMGPLRAVDMPPVLDLEWDVVVRSTRKWSKRDGDYWSQLAPNEILDRVLKWLDVVEKRTGRIPIVYTSRAWWDGRIKSDALLGRLKRYPIWLSAMEEKDLQVERPGTRGGWADKWHWTLWQFTNRGDLSKAGVRNPANPRLEGIDVNLFRGSVADFRKAMGIVSPIVVAESETTPASGPSAAAREAPESEPAKNAAKPAEETPKEATKEPLSEPPKEAAIQPVPEALKETPKNDTVVAVVPSDTAKPADSGSAGAMPEPGRTVATTDPPKEAMKEPPSQPPMQVAKEPSPEAPKEAPKEPAPETLTETSKTETQVAVVPIEAAKPTERGSTSTMPEPGGAVAATEPPKEVAKETPSETQKEPLPETSKEEPKSEADVAVAPSEAARQTESGSTGAIPEPGATVAASEPPKEPMKEPPPEPPKETAKEPVPETPKEAAKEEPAKEPGSEAPKELVKEPVEEPPPVMPTTEPQVAAVPGREGGSKPDAGAGDPGVAAAPPATTEPKEEPAKETQVAGMPTTGTSGPGGEVATANVQSANSPPDSVRTADAVPGLPRSSALSPSIIEIVLANGRVLRVHADIDPQVLMRFVTLLEK
ncbi:MAG TPA: GH25 family lysozyme [Xanthobacteraceae bacterium]|nr:GH25 family lysozyme [Xanthobacteraceae bacterium]